MHTSQKFVNTIIHKLLRENFVKFTIFVQTSWSDCEVESSEVKLMTLTRPDVVKKAEACA